MANPLYNDADYRRLDGSEGVREDEIGRSAWRKDYARLLHAPSFRRLQGKTQLFPGDESDFFRNRLTHSLEVAQIASGIAAKLNAADFPKYHAEASVSTELVEFASIAHDLGHPPFGHNGEKALDALMQEHGGFEGNAQTFRILAVTERKLIRGTDSTNFGLALTMRALAATLKYDHEINRVRADGAKLEKGYYASEKTIVDKVKEAVAPTYRGTDFKTVECSIMDLADDIAYSTYDLEDALQAGFVTPLSLVSVLHGEKDVREQVYKKTNAALEKYGYAPLESAEDVIGYAIDVFELNREFETSLLEKPVELRIATLVADQELATFGPLRSSFTAQRVGDLIKRIFLDYDEEHPALSHVRLDREGMCKVEVLKHLNYELVIRSPRLAIVEHRGQELVRQLFGELLEARGALLPKDWQKRYKEAEKKGKSEACRVVCDYIAGMTDRYAADVHGRLFGQGASIFKPM